MKRAWSIGGCPCDKIANNSGMFMSACSAANNYLTQFSYHTGMTLTCSNSCGHLYNMVSAVSVCIISLNWNHVSAVWSYIMLSVQCSINP